MREGVICDVAREESDVRGAVGGQFGFFGWVCGGEGRGAEEQGDFGFGGEGRVGC